MYQYVREAFYCARHERRPVVLGVPYDLQKEPLPNIGAYQPSTAVMPRIEPLPPHPHQVEQLVEKLTRAKCPIVLAGRGVLMAGAVKEVEEVADGCRALLGTTLLARGMFDHNPFALGVAGGFARDVAREMGAKADLVVAFGTSLNYYTVDSGSMFPKAEIVQIDIDPAGLTFGTKSGDLHLHADAKLAAEAILKKLPLGTKTAANVRSAELARRIKEEPADAAEFMVDPGTLDPRRVIEELDRIIPKDFDSVSGSGHQSYFHSVMRGRKPENYHAIRAFGAIGSGISYAIGVAAARRNGRVALFEGDGSFLMHVQELEMVARHQLKLLFIIFNDGAYGAEIHKLRADGVDDSGSVSWHRTRGAASALATACGSNWSQRLKPLILRRDQGARSKRPQARE
jgi:thiamine pyrophosphate-dependent acetolactate synthase large subunit-like protein